MRNKMFKLTTSGEDDGPSLLSERHLVTLYVIECRASYLPVGRAGTVAFSIFGISTCVGFVSVSLVCKAIIISQFVLFDR